MQRESRKTLATTGKGHKNKQIGAMARAKKNKPDKKVGNPNSGDENVPTSEEESGKMKTRSTKGGGKKKTVGEPPDDEETDEEDEKSQKNKKRNKKGRKKLPNKQQMFDSQEVLKARVDVEKEDGLVGKGTALAPATRKRRQYADSTVINDSKQDNKKAKGEEGKNESEEVWWNESESDFLFFFLSSRVCRKTIPG